MSNLIFSDSDHDYYKTTMGQSFTTTTLHQAIQNNNQKQLKYILKHQQCDLNEVVDDKTALYVAVVEEDHQAIKWLLHYSADPNVICSIEKNSWAFDWSVIHEACWQGKHALLQKFIRHGGNVDLQAHQKMSPLHVAAWFGHREVVKLLIDSGCDVNHLDRFKESAIVMPICQGDYETVRSLLMAGCKLNSRSWANIRKIQCKYDLEFRDQIYTQHGPFSLFTLAIKYVWLKIALLLLQHGFNPNKYSVMDIMEDLKSNVGTIDSEGQKLIECFLAAGYRFRGSDERELRQLKMCEGGEPKMAAIQLHEDMEIELPLEQDSSQDDDVAPEPSTNATRTTIRNTSFGEPRSRPNSYSGVDYQQIRIVISNADPRIQSLGTAVNKDFMDHLLSSQGLRQPYSLKQSCRTAIRVCLRISKQHASIVSSVLKLQLPEVLKQYLLLYEFGDPMAECEIRGPYYQGYLDTEKLYFAMPRRIKHQNVHPYVRFWMACCCRKL